MWLSHDFFAIVVENSWAITCSGNPPFVLAQKLKLLKQNLKVWNRDIFGQLKVRISEADSSVLSYQQTHDADPSKEKHLELNTAKTALHNWLKAEPDFWNQRSKISWLQDGDRNTKFFHQSAKFRGIFNHIDSILVDNSEYVEEKSN